MPNLIWRHSTQYFLSCSYFSLMLMTIWSLGPVGEFIAPTDFIIQALFRKCERFCVNCMWDPQHFKKVLLIHLTYNLWSDKVRWWERCHSSTDSHQDGYNSQSWASLKPGDFINISHLGGRSLNIWVIFCWLPRCVSWNRTRTTGTRTGTHLRLWWHRQWFIPTVWAPKAYRFELYNYQCIASAFEPLNSIHNF